MWNSIVSIVLIPDHSIFKMILNELNSSKGSDYDDLREYVSRYSTDCIGDK